jgi:hypothetical protein
MTPSSRRRGQHGPEVLLVRRRRLPRLRLQLHCTTIAPSISTVLVLPHRCVEEVIHLALSRRHVRKINLLAHARLRQVAPP